MFDGLDSTLNVKVEDGAAVFVTFDMRASSDPPDLFDTVERVFTEAGWETSSSEEG